MLRLKQKYQENIFVGISFYYYKESMSFVFAVVDESQFILVLCRGLGSLVNCEIYMRNLLFLMSLDYEEVDIFICYQQGKLYYIFIAQFGKIYENIKYF